MQLRSPSRICWGSANGSPEAIQKFVVRESNRNPHCQRELAEHVKNGVSNARTQQAPFWNLSFLDKMATDHVEGRNNYVLEINAVLTLEAVERLLLRDAGPRRRESGVGSMLQLLGRLLSTKHSVAVIPSGIGRMSE
jgi:hypothetical protein